MTKKQFIVSTIICSAILISGAVSLGTKANAITFTESNSQELKRTMPTDGALLSYYDAIKEPKKSVVNIFTKKTLKQQAVQNPFMNDPLFQQFFGQNFGNMVPKDRVEKSLGSGVIITSDGYIVTNNHVVDSADEIMVVLSNSKKEIPAKLVGTDPKTDIAVIKIEAKELPPIAFADSDKVHEGDVVFAIGNPFGVGETITQGIISALNKSGMGLNDYENFIQTDASINPGNSGGALVDSKGGLIGINSAILSKTGQNNGIGFAIPSSTVKKICKELVEKGKVERGRIGISMRDMGEKERKYYNKEQGAVVLEVEKDSPADNAGMKRGDLILKLNNQTVPDSTFLKNLIGSLEPNTQVTLEILRSGKPIKITLKLQKISDKTIVASNASFELLDGLGIADISNALAKQYGLSLQQKGALVVSVKPNSEASKNEFMEGDLIVQIEDKEVASAQGAIDIKKSIGSLKNKMIYVRRKGVIYQVVVE